MSLKDILTKFVIKQTLLKKENRPMLNALNRLWTFLEGKKSTWLAIVSLVAIAGNIGGYIGSDQTQQILAICGATYAGTMAEKINRLIAVLKETTGQAKS